MRKELAQEEIEQHKKQIADAVLRLQPTLPLKMDTELVLFVHNYIKGNGTLPNTQDMNGWSQIVEALDEYVKQIGDAQPTLPEIPTTEITNRIAEWLVSDSKSDPFFRGKMNINHATWIASQLFCEIKTCLEALKQPPKEEGKC